MYRGLSLVALVLVWAIVPAILQANSSVAGSVRDNKNAPLKAVQVHLLDANGRDTIGLTDEAGRFSIPDLEPGEYRARARKKFYTPSDPQTLRVNSSPMGEIRFTLSLSEKPPVPSLSTADIRPFLPEGPGKELFAGRCGNCHGIGVPLSQSPMDRDGWNGLLNRLSYITAFTDVINDQVRGPLVDYLAKNFGPGSTLTDELGEKAEKANKQEVPVGNNLMYTTWDLHLKAPEPHTAAPDNDGNVWVTEWGAHKVSRVHISTGQVTQYELKTPNLRPFSMGIAPDGKAWFTVSNGPELGVVDPKSGTLTEIQIPVDEGQTANGAHVTVSDGKVWFGVYWPGRIVSYDPKNQQFKSYKVEEGKGIPDGITRHEDKFWFVLRDTTKVGYLEPETGKVKTFPVPTPKIRSEHLTIDRKGRVWLAEQDHDKLWVLDPSTEHFTDYDLPYSCEPYMVHLGAEGKIWVNCFMRESLVQVDPDTMKMVEYPQPIGLGGIGRSLLNDSSGNMWFASWYAGKIVRVTELAR